MARKTFPLTVISKVADEIEEHAPSQAQRLRRAVKELSKPISHGVGPQTARFNLAAQVKRLGADSLLPPKRKRK